MGGILRRRELILPDGGEPVGPLVYSLENRVVVDSEHINTGVSPWLFENTTLLFDMNITTNPTNTAQAYRYRLMQIYNSTTGSFAFILCKPSQWNAGCRARIYNSKDTDDVAKIITSAAGRKRVVITHVAGSKTINAWGKSGTAAVVEKTITTSNTDYTTDAILYFGGGSNGYGLPPGTINLAQVYNVILPQEDIDAFLA